MGVRDKWGYKRRTESGLDHEVMSQMFKNTLAPTKYYENFIRQHGKHAFRGRKKP